MSDDIFIFGKGQTDQEAMVEHDKHLKQVLQRLQENGLTANLPKCEFRKPKMEFYGMVFSKDGIEPDPKKVDALIMMTPPTSVGESIRNDKLSSKVYSTLLNHNRSYQEADTEGANV